MEAYKQQMADFQPIDDRYMRELNDTGITSPQGYTVGPDPSVPYVLTALPGQPGTAPLYLNPVASLYTQGNLNRVLYASSNPTCDVGCMAGIDKPDPRVHSIKPLYTASVYQAPKGQALPTPYNVVGMY
jgi:hypothetical protein